MNQRPTLRRLAVVGAAALVAATLSPAPAQALPVYTQSEFDTDSTVHDDSGNCTANDTSAPDQDNVPVVENGPATTVTTNAAGTVTDGATDTQTGVANLTVSGSVSSSGGNIKTFEQTAAGSAAVSNTVATSTCEIHAYSDAEMDFAFTVTTPGFLTFTRKVRGGAMYNEFYIEADTTNSNDPYHETYHVGLLLDSTDVLYLPAGQYNGYFYSEVSLSSSVADSRTSSSVMRATFAPVGSQSAAAAGKGKRYVSLPATARSCAANSITTSITGNKGRAKQIKQVTFLVNGKKAKTVKKPKKGQSVVLTGITAGADVNLKAVAKLNKKANGKPRKPVEVTAAYVACAPPA